MRILIVTPAPRGSQVGNRVTAERWAGHLRALGHRVEIANELCGQRADLMIALHARKSSASIRRWRGPLVVALTGTDMTGRREWIERARRSIARADALVALHPLVKRFARRVTVIHQSAPRMRRPKRGFDVCVIGHLRPLKDPFRAAYAARRLPADSRIRILQVGGAMSPRMERMARAEAAGNPRYRWLGEVPRAKALNVLARCRLLVISSRQEGGANVVTEALACRVPVIASRIPGNVGLLGDGYPGYYEVGDTAGLAALLSRAERDARFCGRLDAWCRRRAGIADPSRERRAWKKLIETLRRGSR